MNDFILLTIIVVLTGVCLVLSDMLATVFVFGILRRRAGDNP